MAESAVMFLVFKLKALLEEEVNLLTGIQAQVRDMVDELERIQAFLRTADAMEDSDPLQKVWVNQVRDVAHQMEDVLDMFRHSHSHDHGHGFRASLHKLHNIAKKWRARRQVAADIEDLKHRIQSLERNKFVDQAGSTSARQVHQFSQGDATLLEEAELVAIGERKRELLKLLMKENPTRQVVPVVGMGGLGKTTLVKQLYEDAEVQKHFKVHAWITVSRSFQMNKLLRHMIHKIFEVLRQPVPQDEEVIESMDDDSLKARIRKLLQNRRYLIVLDDIWHIPHWDAINHVMPNNNHGSRVMLTTRNVNVASASCLGNRDMFYHLQPLSPEDSWTLFCKKTFHGESCLPNLEKHCRSILSKCGGLPLAIVAIGSVLATKDKTNVDEWIAVCGSIGVEIQENDQLDNMKKVLYLSFSDLPYHLKSCFLYLSIFPDIYKIDHMRLIRLWLAEGFIIETEGRTPEEVAQSYIKALWDRSLIQATETTTDGRVKSYRIHDLLREIIISKSREQNFAGIVREQGTMWSDKVRRLSILNTLQNVQKKRTPSKLRSLLIFGVEDSLNEFSITKLFPTGLQLLTVLDLEGAHLQVFPKVVVKLVFLKYLSLRKSKVRQIPSSIKNLRYLQTLDLKHSHVVELPADILYLKQLRHLLVYRYEVESYARFDAKYGVKLPAGISSLQSLQKLCFIDANQHNGDLMAELGKMNQLRRLGISKLRKQDGKTLCLSIQNMKNLRSLSVSSAEMDELIDLSYMSSAPEFIQRLYLTGRLENLPHWIPVLPNLVRLFLKWSRLKEDPLVHLQGLPNLVHLELLQVFDGESLHFAAGGFPRLKLLGIDKLDELLSVTIEKGAMPRLEKLIIQRCESLKKVPYGFEHLNSLKCLEFFDMPNELITALNPDDGKDHWRIAHVPAVDYFYWKVGGWDVYSLVNDGEGFYQGTSATRSNTWHDRRHDALLLDNDALLLDNDELENLKEVLCLSFNDLPYNLKACFLCLSVFPEGHLIKRMKIIRLWIAEKFVEAREGRTLEEVAEDYLKELLNRNLMLVGGTTSDGRVKTYRIHVLLREIIVSKSRDQNFAATVKEHNTVWPDRVRRLSIHNALQTVQQSRSFPQLRSLFMFGEVSRSSVRKYLSNDFRLLRVLDIEAAPIKTFPREIMDLFYLSYLSLRNTQVKVIPRSIGNLVNLETLDLKHTYVSELPVEILKLLKLRHLLVYHLRIESYAHFNSKFGFKVLSSIGDLQDLQKLCFIEANQGCGVAIKDLAKLKQLRRLGIMKLRKEDGSALCSSLESLTKLRSFSVYSAGENEIIDLQHLSSPPQFLERLYLAGRLGELPSWIPSLHSLVKLCLKWSKLENDPMILLQDLPNLVHLELLQTCDNDLLSFKGGGFKKLKVLGLDKFDKLSCVTVEKGAMPCLERLTIQRCELLKRVPSGLKNLTKLKSLQFFNMPYELILKLRPDGEGEDYGEVAHIPEVYSAYWRDGSWDVYPIECFKKMENIPSPAGTVRRSHEPSPLWKV